jgi:hypothetical protein
VPDTGLRYIEIRGAGGTTGTWTLTGKLALPKGFSGIGTAPGGVALTTIEFVSPGNATAAFTVAAAKGSLALPEFDSLKDPKGVNLNIDYDVPSKKGFGIKGVPLPEPGKHQLKVKAATAGGFTVKIKWKVLKPVKKILTEGQVIADPVPTDIDPSAGDISETLAVTVTVDFAVQGARVIFRKGVTAITIPASQVTVDEDTATFNLVLSSFQKGTYDVEIENPDTGKGILPAAFAIVLSPAEITSVSPGFGYANQAAAVVTVHGKFMNTGATVVLNQGADVIEGTNVSGVATALQATFDLTGHSWGFFDITVTNPGVIPTQLANCYEIRNPLPVVSSISPENNRAAVVVNCTITGAEFDDTPTVVLRMAGQSDIPGTAVIFNSDTELTCTFDTTGAAPGSWDLVVTNPDLGEGSLSACFGVSGPVGSPAKVLTASYDYDGPPSVVYNPARDEFAVAYVDENGSNFDLWLERLDGEGGSTGDRVKVSQSASSIAKRDAVVAFDHENNEYMVAWAEMSVSSVTGTPLWAVFAHRVGAASLGLLSSNNIKISDSALVSTSKMDSFNNYRPDVAWDATNNLWDIIFQQEWSVSADDFDIIDRTVSPSDAMGTPVGTYITAYHESEPSIAFDPVSGALVRAHNYRGSAGALLQVRVGTTVVSSDSVNQKDPDVVMDTNTGRMILTWTQVPSAAPMYVKGGTYSGPTLVGSLLTIAQGTDDNLMVRKAYNSKTKETLFAWTRRDSLGQMKVVTRRATTSGSGLAFITEEHEPAPSATSEGMAFVGANSTNGQALAFWLKTLTGTGLNGYSGSLLGGIYRGREIWLQRYQ